MGTPIFLNPSREQTHKPSPSIGGPKGIRKFGEVIDVEHGWWRILPTNQSQSQSYLWSLPTNFCFLWWFLLLHAELNSIFVPKEPLQLSVKTFISKYIKNTFLYSKGLVTTMPRCSKSSTSVLGSYFDDYHPDMRYKGCMDIEVLISARHIYINPSLIMNYLLRRLRGICTMGICLGGVCPHIG